MIAPPEEWRTIAEYPDYAISSHGRVKRIVVSRVKRQACGPIKLISNRWGYQVVNLTGPLGLRVRRINRLVCEAFIGPAPSTEHHAAHADGNRANNTKGNLRWATPFENEKDKIEHGTRAGGIRHYSRTSPEALARGVRHGNSKLTDDAVLEIRGSADSCARLALRFGVSESTIFQVRAGNTWKHVGRDMLETVDQDRVEDAIGAAKAAFKGGK